MDDLFRIIAHRPYLWSIRQILLDAKIVHLVVTSSRQYRGFSKDRMSVWSLRATGGTVCSPTNVVVRSPPGEGTQPLNECLRVLINVHLRVGKAGVHSEAGIPQIL